MDHFRFFSELRRPATRDKCARLFAHRVDNGDKGVDANVSGQLAGVFLPGGTKTSHWWRGCCCHTVNLTFSS